MGFRTKKKELNEDEIFKFGAKTFNITEILSDINSGKLKPKLESNVKISDYAKSILGIKQDMDPKDIGHSIFGGIDPKHLETLTDEDLNRPAIAAKIKNKDGQEWVLVIDGNHRIAKNVLEGKTAMPMYILSNKQIQKYMTDHLKKSRGPKHRVSEKKKKKNNAKSLVGSGAWNKKGKKYNKYNPPNTGNKGVSANKGFVG